VDATAAVGLATRARTLVGALSRLRAEIDLTLSDASEGVGDNLTAVSCAEEAERIGAALGDVAVQWRGRLQNHLVRFSTDPSIQVESIYLLAEQAIEALTAAGDDRGLTMAFLLRTDVHNSTGHLWAVSADARQGLRHAHRADQVGWFRSKLIRRVMAPYQIGDGTPTELERLLEEINTEFGTDPGVDQALAEQRYKLPGYRGRIEESYQLALAYYAELLDRGSTVEAAKRLANDVAWCQRWGGDLTGAAQSLSIAAHLLESAGETGQRSSTLADLAVVLAQLGRDGDARSALAQSRAITADNDLVNEINHAAADGLLLAHRGDRDGSDRRFEDGLRLAITTEFLPVQGELWLARSFAGESLGDKAGALTAARQALACFERKEHVPPIQTAQARVADLRR
jgi:tetratricopeptide (TPR) repeat protein